MINQDCIKVLKTINSCQTPEQLAVAERMRNNFVKRYMFAEGFKDYNIRMLCADSRAFHRVNQIVGY